MIVDVKNPWSNKTFDKKIKWNFETEEFKMEKEYEGQLQGYMHLANCDHAFLIYTLNEHKWMELIGKANHYSENFTLLDRTFCLYLERDKNYIDEYAKRVPAIKEEIEIQKSIISTSIAYTKSNLDYLQKLVE